MLLAAMDGYRPEGDWKQRITSLALHVREAFGRQPQLAAVWGRYASSGAGSRLVMEEVLHALRISGLPDEEIPVRYHRLAVLIAALIASEAGVSTVTAEEQEQGKELFRVAVLGAAPERFPTLSHFARGGPPPRGGPPRRVRRHPGRPPRPHRGDDPPRPGRVRRVDLAL